MIGFEDGAPVLLRAGALTRSEIEGIVGRLNKPDAAIRSPGQMESHYAPRAALRLNVDTPWDDELLLGFGPAKNARRNLSPGGNLREAAANLFAMLRELDKETSRIAVMPIPDTGLGEAINDRLKRAANR